MKKIKQHVLTVIVWTMILVFLIILEWPDGYTRVIFCDVGQGDAILIQRNFKQILIDAGANNSVSSCLNEYIPFWDKRIELAIATHADKDHIGGFETIFNQFFVEKMIVSKLGKKTDFFSTFQQLVSREKDLGMMLIELESPIELSIDDELFITSMVPQVVGVEGSVYNHRNTETVLWDTLSRQEAWLAEQKLDYNALSVVTFFKVGSFDLLLTGDLGVNEEQALIDKGLITDVEVLKIGHHGSKTSTGDELLQASTPEISVISVGKNNTYRHPNPQVVSKIRQFGSEIYRTDVQGTIVIVTDGDKYWIEE